jgi:RNA polymerase primary sigma factor
MVGFMSDGMGSYLEEIGRTPLIDAEKERELARIIELGSEAEAFAPELQSSLGGLALSRSEITTVRTSILELQTPQLNDHDEALRTASPFLGAWQRRADDSESLLAIDRQITAKNNAKELFIRSNLRLVVSNARRYPLPPGMELLDLVQEGNLGLEHAVDKFDWRKGFKFSTYATFWIRQSIGRAIDHKGGLVRTPGEKNGEVRRAVRLRDTDGTPLTSDQEMLRRLSNPVSLETPIGHTGGETTLKDVVLADDMTPEDTAIKALELGAVAHMLDELSSSRIRHAVQLRFGLIDGEKRTYREVGQTLGITAEAARRRVNTGVAELRVIYNGRAS